MTRPFLITGLPRSRTAWLATACNQQWSTVCHHEPIARFPSWRDSLGLWNNDEYVFTGISDSALGFHLPEITHIHAPRILVVQRTLADVKTSLRSIGIASDRYCEVLHECLQSSMSLPNVRAIPYEGLDDPYAVSVALEWLMPGIEVDLTKVVQLCRMNIQVSLSLVLEEVAGADVNSVLGADIVARINQQ